MRAFSLVLLCLALPLASVQAASQTLSTEASRYVETVGADAIEILSSSHGLERERDERLRMLLGDAFALPVMCRSVIGPDWNSASDWEQRAFCDVFADYLLTYVIGVLEDEAPRGIEVTAVHATKGADFRVTTAVERPGEEPTEMDWIIQNRDGAFHVVDVIVSQVSLISTYRSEFSGLARRQGMEALTAALERKVAGR